MKDFLQNVQNIFFHFLFRFLLKMKKKNEPPPLFPPFWGGSSAASPLEIWDVMPPYLKTLFEQKKNSNLMILTIFAQTTPLSTKYISKMYLITGIITGI